MLLPQLMQHSSRLFLRLLPSSASSYQRDIIIYSISIEITSAVTNYYQIKAEEKLFVMD